MTKIVYTLKESEKSGELHLFEATPTKENKCRPSKNSICGAMKKEDSIDNIFACQTKDKARMLCAEEGEQVCGNCIKSLYKTY